MLLYSKICQGTLVVLMLAVCPSFGADEAGLLVRARARFREAKYDDAARLATAVIQQDAESTPAYRLRAAACEQLVKLDLAIADLSTAESIGVATKVVVTLRRDDMSSRGA
jgi:hypothetical protein